MILRSKTLMELLDDLLEIAREQHWRALCGVRVLQRQQGEPGQFLRNRNR